VIRAELRAIWAWEERHRRLVARMIIAAVLTLLVDAVGTLLIWHFEGDVSGSGIDTFGDALFFTAVQLLTVSSQLPAPVTTGGRLVDVFLETWAVFVVTAVAGSFAAFFTTRDAARRG
jgi:voltage-gated potassium channel